MSSGEVDLDFRIMKTEDKEEVVQFLRKYFQTDEPLNDSLKMITEENPVNEELDEFCMAGFDEGFSLMCFRDRKLIAVILNFYIHRGKKEPFICKDEKFAKIVNLLDYVGKKSDPFQKYPGCDKAMAIGIISVDETCRGKGVAKLLVEKSRELAKQNGCGFIKVECTSYFSAAAVKKLGFELIYSMDYADYKVNGEVQFKPAAPHKAITVYATKID